MSSKQELFLFLLHLVSFSGQIYATNDAMFSEDELKLFASLGLCGRFGGECGAVCPHRFITHKWGVPLCENNTLVRLECCIGPAPTGPSEDGDELAKSFTTTATTPETVTATPPHDHTKGSCGQRVVPHDRRKRIVGGQVASPETWPWLVAFRSMLGSHACSGAVIDRRWVITAAHCFKYISNPSLWRVRIGEYNLLFQEVGERDLHIQEIVMYPGYRPQPNRRETNETLRTKYVHDIALVRLSQDALTEPLCLPLPGDESFLDYSDSRSDPDDESDYGEANMRNEIETSSRYESNTRFMVDDDDIDDDDDVHKYNAIPLMGFNQLDETGIGLQLEEKSSSERGSTCWVAGWGLTLDDDVEDHVLREVSGDLVGSEKCSQMWGEQLDDEMLCFGDGTYGPCVGDSGGPLSCERDGRFYLTGVVSWGTEECNISGYPSVFTNMEPYLTWISERISKH